MGRCCCITASCTLHYLSVSFVDGPFMLDVYS